MRARTGTQHLLSFPLTQSARRIHRCVCRDIPDGFSSLEHNSTNINKGFDLLKEEIMATYMEVISLTEMKFLVRIVESIQEVITMTASKKRMSQNQTHYMQH